MATIAGLFERTEDAERAIETLNNQGYTKDELSIVSRDPVIQERLVADKDAVSQGVDAGIMTGAPIGGLTGLLVGMGALVIPGLGPIIAAGTLATALGATAAGAAVGGLIGAGTGGLIGALVGRGISQDQAQVYAEGVKRGGILLTVDVAEDRAAEVRGILNDAGAVNIDTRASEWRQAGWQRFDETVEPTTDYPTMYRDRGPDSPVTTVTPRVATSTTGAGSPNNTDATTLAATGDDNLTRTGVPAPVSDSPAPIAGSPAPLNDTPAPVPSAADLKATPTTTTDTGVAAPDIPVGRASEEDVIDTLNHLIITCRDGENGYRQAADGVNNSELKTLFNSYALQRARFAEELQSQVRSLGGEPEEGGSLMGAAYHGWMNVKAAVTSGDEGAVLDDSERGEDGAVNAYEQALLTPLPPEVQSIVSRQYNEIKQAHDRVRSLRDATGWKETH